MEDHSTGGAARTARWRARLKEQRLPETDDVDTAIAAAFSIFISKFQKSDDEQQQQAADRMVALVVKALMTAGYSGDALWDKAENRVYYHQQCDLYPSATAVQKARWAAGPPPVDAAFLDCPELDADDVDRPSWDYLDAEDGFDE